MRKTNLFSIMLMVIGFVQYINYLFRGDLWAGGFSLVFGILSLIIWQDETKEGEE